MKKQVLKGCLNSLFIFFLLLGCSTKDNALEFSAIRLEVLLEHDAFTSKPVFNVEELIDTLNIIDNSINNDEYAKYNNKFFESNFLFIDFYTGSSSIKKVIESIDYNGNQITLKIGLDSPVNVSLDIITILYLFEVSKNNLITSEIEIIIINI